MIPPFTFATAGQIRFGRGTAFEGAAAAVLAFGDTVALVHGATAARARWLIDALRGAGAEVQTIACPGEPTLAALETARTALRADPPEVVVALGGGVFQNARLLAHLQAPTLGIWAVHPPQRHVQPKVAQLVRTLAEALDPPPWLREGSVLAHA